ncbi:hypothetical protein NIES2098_69560 [Calothrix sp. NIES-2098]|nr:hypothetical protein NIES2098_69560 [Calothrix sp. NIES-2098]
MAKAVFLMTEVVFLVTVAVSLMTDLSVVDSSKDKIEELEKQLSQLCEKMLTVVAIKYGKDSREYEMAGGVRNSERVFLGYLPISPTSKKMGEPGVMS